MEFSALGILMLLLIVPISGLILYLLVNVKRIGDLYNLRFRRSRTVRADMRTQSGRRFSRYVVPDARGFFRHKGGVYHFPDTGFEIDGRYGIPVHDFIEGQIFAEDGNIVMSEEEYEVNGKKMKIPQFMVSHAKLRPKLLRLARRDEKGVVKMADEPPVTALEVADALDSKIVNDITNASLADLKLGQMLLLLIVLLGLCVLGFIGLYTQVNGLDQMILEAGAQNGL